MPEQVSLTLAKGWIALGQIISAEELHDKGLINQLSEGNVVETADNFSTPFIIDGPPLSHLYEIKLLHSSSQQSL